MAQTKPQHATQEFASAEARLAVFAFFFCVDKTILGRPIPPLAETIIVQLTPRSVVLQAFKGGQVEFRGCSLGRYEFPLLFDSFIARTDLTALCEQTVVLPGSVVHRHLVAASWFRTLTVLCPTRDLSEFGANATRPHRCLVSGTSHKFTDVQALGDSRHVVTCSPGMLSLVDLLHMTTISTFGDPMQKSFTVGVDLEKRYVASCTASQITFLDPFSWVRVKSVALVLPPGSHLTQVRGFAITPQAVYITSANHLFALPREAFDVAHGPTQVAAKRAFDSVAHPKLTISNLCALPDGRLWVPRHTHHDIQILTPPSLVVGERAPCYFTLAAVQDMTENRVAAATISLQLATGLASIA